MTPRIPPHTCNWPYCNVCDHEADLETPSKRVCTCNEYGPGEACQAYAAIYYPTGGFPRVFPNGTQVVQTTQSNTTAEPKHTCHAQFYGFCSACADLAAATPPAPASNAPKCECGSDAIESPYHSQWCPKKPGDQK